MLLGRLKNALLAYGLEIYLQIPKVVHGHNIRILSPEKESIQFRDISQFGHGRIWFDANWELSQELSEADINQDAEAKGKVIKF